jgi:hypothetical protein
MDLIVLFKTMPKNIPRHLTIFSKIIRRTIITSDSFNYVARVIQSSTPKHLVPAFIILFRKIVIMFHYIYCGVRSVKHIARKATKC